MTMKTEVTEALLTSGWHPDRHIDITTWLDKLNRAGLIINQHAVDIWSEFGGLFIERSSIEKPSCILFDPIEASSTLADDAIRLCADYNENLSPIGVWSEQYPCYIAESGWVMAIGPGWDWKLGDDLEETLELVVLDSRQITCIKVTHPGALPWP